MDKDLLEEDIIRHKIEAIDAVVTYAFVHEPLQWRQPEPQAKPLPIPSDALSPTLPGRFIAIVSAQSTPSPRPEVPLHSPPTPYSELNSGAGRRPVIPTDNVAIIPHRRHAPYTRKKPDPCIFCGKTYTRIEGLWDHLENHLKCARNGPLACPRAECKGMVLENPGRFKAHTARFHGCSFRVRIKLATSKTVKSPVGSVVASPPMPSENRTRIVLRVGGRRLERVQGPGPRRRGGISQN